MKDSILIYKIKKGNEEAIEEFIKKYYPEIYKYVYRKIGNVQTSEDITQETFERFFRSINNYIHKGKAKNYLYVISNNLCKNQYKQKVFQSIDNIEDKLESNYGEYAISYIDEKITINEAINLLPEELQEIIYLYYFQDLKLKEIAQILNIKLSLVKYRLKRSKEKLGEILKEEEFVYDKRFRLEKSSQ